MILNCPKCNTPASAEDFNMESGIITCQPCNEAYHVEGKNIDRENLSHKETPIPPKGITVNSQLSYLELSYAPKRSYGSFFFLLAFIGLLIYVYIKMSNDVQWAGLENLDIGTIIFFTLMLVYFLYIVIKIIMDFVNKVYIKVDNQGLEVTTRPIKLFSKDHTIKASEIEQLFVARYAVKRKNHKSYLFALDVKLKNHTGTINLLNGIKTPQFAFFIEKEMEKRMGIEDKMVMGEYHPNHVFKPGLGQIIQLASLMRKKR